MDRERHRAPDREPNREPGERRADGDAMRDRCHLHLLAVAGSIPAERDRAPAADVPRLRAPGPRPRLRSMTTLGPREIIRALGLEPHPEGGWFRETWRSAAADGGRSPGTAIYYLLEAGDHSHWHRIDADETWHWYAGGPLSMTLSPNGHDAEAFLLGPEIQAGQRPQATVPAGWWQTAVSMGAFTLLGCTVAPGFDFAGFEMAPPDWRPTPRGAG